MTGLRTSRVLRVLAKELRETLRDRNLVVHVVLVPLFLYPVLGFALFQVLLVMRGMSEDEVTRIATGSGVPESLVDSLAAREGVEVVRRTDLFSANEFRNRSAAETEGEGLAAALVWRRGEGGEGDSAVVYWDRSRERSAKAREDVEAAVETWRRERTLAALGAVGLGEAEVDLWSVEEENTASAEQRGRRLLAVALPLVLLLMLGQGAFYSTLDTIVGERERGTLETLLTAPLGRGELLLGKFLMVVLSSVVALVLNLASLTLFLGFLLDQVDASGEIRIVLAPQALLAIVPAAFLTAAFLAAVFMVIAAFSRNYREGQAMLTPVYVLILIPGMLVSFDDQPFSLAHATVPVLNAVALFESALEGELPPGPIAVTLVVLAVTAAAALALAARIATREETYLDPGRALRRLIPGRWRGKA
ncbi:MAG: ABC transporter permease subunit [Candidatus Eiseniibacteriota bacterium]